MIMQEKKYFFLSGIVSVSLYLVLCASFLFYINTPTPKKFDSTSKETVIELEIISTISKEKSVARKSVAKEQIVKKSTSRAKTKTANFKSLFANVKTKAKKTVEKEVNAVRENIDPSRFKSKFQKQRKSDNTSVSKLLSDVKTSTNRPKVISTSKGETHEYYSKIKDILWERWTPRLLENGLKVEVLVMITKAGKFDFRIKKYSNDPRFDESLKEFLQAQRSESFPPHDIKSRVAIDIEFRSEG